MHKIIKNGAVTDDNWTVINDNEVDINNLPAGDLILPLSVWQKFANELSNRKIGIWLNSNESPSDIKDNCHSLPIIAINFPVFTDGRGYSYAHVLRAQYGYSGELRAIGDVLMDQLFFMKRCGFNSFSMRTDQNLETAVSHLADFNVTYQASIDNSKPLFHLR